MTPIDDCNRFTSVPVLWQRLMRRTRVILPRDSLLGLRVFSLRGFQCNGLRIRTTRLQRWYKQSLRWAFFKHKARLWNHTLRPVLQYTFTRAPQMWQTDLDLRWSRLLRLRAKTIEPRRPTRTFLVRGRPQRETRHSYAHFRASIDGQISSVTWRSLTMHQRRRAPAYGRCRDRRLLNIKLLPETGPTVYNSLELVLSDDTNRILCHVSATKPDNLICNYFHTINLIATSNSTLSPVFHRDASSRPIRR